MTKNKKDTPHFRFPTFPSTQNLTGSSRSYDLLDDRLRGHPTDLLPAHLPTRTRPGAQTSQELFLNRFERDQPFLTDPDRLSDKEPLDQAPSVEEDDGDEDGADSCPERVIRYPTDRIEFVRVA